MNPSNVFTFPVPPRISAGAPRITGEADSCLACWYSIDSLLEDITSPYRCGWVESEWLCLQPRTTSEFAVMFELMGGGIGYGFVGFRNVAEGLLCEQAALLAGSPWRLMDYYRRDRGFGGDGLGILALALATYQRCCDSGLFTGRLLVPPRGRTNLNSS